CEDATKDRAVVGAPGGVAAAGDLVPDFRGVDFSIEHRSLRTSDSALRVLRIVRGRRPQRPAGGRDALRTRPPSLLDGPSREREVNLDLNGDLKLANRNCGAVGGPGNWGELVHRRPADGRLVGDAHDLTKLHAGCLRHGGRARLRSEERRAGKERTYSAARAS